MAKVGRPPRLTRDRIVAAVVDLLEKDGVESVSTRTVGEALGVHPTALYRHFKDMDELVREAADVILAGLVPDPDADDHDDPAASAGGSALDEVHELCRRLRNTLMAHPGAASVTAAGPSRKPNERAFTERMLLLLSRSGLPDADAALAYHALVEFVVGSCAIDTAARGAVPDEVRHQAWRADYSSADSTRFPVSTRLASWLYPSQDDQFEFGLRLLVDSLRARTAGGRVAPPE